MILYSIKIKEQTRKLAAGCSKHCFEVVDKTDEVSYIYLRQGDVDAVWIWFSKSINFTQGKLGTEKCYFSI